MQLSETSRSPSEASSSILRTLLWLCEISSPTGGEKELCDRVVERLRAASLPESIRRYGDSIVVPITRGSRGPKIALVGHLDVVNTSHDGPPRLDGDRVYGPGASDMKSGLALMLDLAEHDRGVCGGVDLTLVFYAREEGPYLDNELGLVLEQDRELRAVDLAVCMEPSDNKLSLGASGSIHAAATFEGKTSHSARPWQGENAIHKAGTFLSELGRLAPRDVVIDGLAYRTVTSATMAQGGRGRNVVPDAFTLNLNHRFAPGVSLDEAKHDVTNLVGNRARIEWKDLSPSALPFAKHPLVVLLSKAGVVGIEPKQAWTDVARFSTLGIPAVNFGPGENAQAHQRNEWTSLSKLVDGQRIIQRWFGNLSKG